MDREMKPIIIVCGMPQSHTSVIAKFLVDNGAKFYHVKDEVMPSPYGYRGYESIELEDYVQRRWRAQKPDLTEFFKGIPDEIVVLKYPTICWFLDELKEFTDRELRMVFCLRNPLDNIESSTEKNSWDIERNLLKYHHIWEIMAQTRCFPLISEKILLKDVAYANGLLYYCGMIRSPNINFNSISYKPRKTTYLRYRVDNALLKFILRLKRCF